MTRNRDGLSGFGRSILNQTLLRRRYHKFHHCLASVTFPFDDLFPLHGCDRNTENGQC
jgi:hypothetical protein